MTLLKLLLLPTLATAHFTLNLPAPVGPFVEDNEATAPCGGVTLDASTAKTTDFHVGGEAVSVFFGHPAGNWLFRTTLDQTASSNWSQIYPIFRQTGQGDYCQPAVAAPSSLVGQKGIFSAVVNSPDGLLFQCAFVNFVEGSGTYDPSVCTNSSSVTAAFQSDDTLTPLVSKDESQTNGTSTTSGANPSSTPSVAAGLVTPRTGLAGSLAAVLPAGLVGAGLI